MTEQAAGQPDRDPQTQLAQFSGEFLALVQLENVVDQDQFERTRFTVSNGVSFIFRGREELPVVPHENGPARPTKILTTDERPVYTAADDFSVWEQAAFEPVMGQDSQGVEYMASSTPRGIVDAAIILAELGLGKTDDHVTGLHKLRDKVAHNICDNEVLGLFDTIYIAAAVDPISGQINEHNGSVDGSILAAFALAGNEQAQNLVEAKRQLVDLEDQKRHITPEGETLKAPGEPLSEAEIQTLSEAHFVAVHTTPTKPQHIAETGAQVIFPTGEYNLGEKEHFPRSTIHWSLNHAVVSHVFGNFAGRAVTIVDRLEGLAKANGAPAVLYGVDTYFSCDPGKPLVLSDDASIIEVHTNHDELFIVQNGNNIHIRAESLTTKDLEILKSFLYGDESTDDAFISGLSRIEDFLGLNKQMAERLEKPSELDSMPKSQAYLRPYKTVYELIKPNLPENPTDQDYKKARYDLLAAIVEGEIDIAKYAELHGEFIEAARVLALRKLIEQKGGKVSLAGGHYMLDDDFNQRQRHVVEALALDSGLHDNHIDGLLEYQYGQARSRAMRADALGKSNFVWQDYSNEGVWVALPSASWQARRHVVRSGMLNLRPRKVSTDLDPILG